MNVKNLDSGDKARLFCEAETSLVVWLANVGCVVWPKEACLLEFDGHQELQGPPKAVRRAKRKKNRGNGQEP